MLLQLQEAKPSPPPQPVPQLARAPARAPKQVQDDEKPPLEAAEAAPAAANEGLAIGSRTAKPAPQPQDVAVPELSAPKPRRRQDVGASTAEQAAPSTAGQSSPGESAAADKLSLAEPSQAEPTRIRALPRGLAATAEADKSSKALEAALSAMQEEEQAGELDQAPPAAAPLSKPVPLPVPQQLGKPRARAAPEQTSQPLSGSTMDSASIDTSAGSRPSAVAPTTVSSETQPAGGAPAVPLEAGESAEGLQELSPAASQRTAATGVQEAAVTTPEAATADKTAAEEGAGELSSIELPLNLPDTPKPPLKPAQPPAKRSAPAQQAAQGADQVHRTPQRWLAMAEEAKASGRKLPATVVASRYSGVMMQLDGGMRGFLPFSCMVPEVQNQARKMFKELNPVGNLEVGNVRQLTSQVLAELLVGQRLDVYVVECKVADSDTLVPGAVRQDCRIILAQTPGRARPHHDGAPPSPAAIEVLQSHAGQPVNAQVYRKTDSCAAMLLDAELESGDIETVQGMLYGDRQSLADIKEGQIVEVILQSAGTDGQGVVLARGEGTGRGAQEVQETIEDVVASGSTAQELEGVLSEVQLLCQALLQREGIFAAKPGRRLKGIAFAPELQVYLSKEALSAEGREAAGGAEVSVYVLLARAGNDVQELEVEGCLSREEMKDALSLALSQLPQLAD